MIRLLFLLLPAAACIGWIILNFFISRRTSTYGIFTLFLIMLGLFLVTDSSYANPDVNPELLVYMILIELFAGPCLVPLMWMYLYQLKHKTKFTTAQWSWVIIPVVFITASALITHLKGVEPIANYLHGIYNEGLPVARPREDHILYAYYLWTFVIFRIVIGTELALGFIMLIVYTQTNRFKPDAFRRFWRKGEAISVVQMQFMNLLIPIIIVVVKILVGNRILQHHPWLLMILSLAMAACVFNIAFTALFGAREKVTLENMRHVMVYNYNDKIKSIIVEFTLDDLLDEAEEEGLRRLREKIGEHIHEDPDAMQQGGAKSTVVKENLFASMARTWDDDSLLSRFQTLMVKEQLFLQPSLTLGDVADRLKTNKTYVSKLVNNTYNLGFPELLNTLRIDYAEQYIINHRSAKQDEIAAACGFLSASAFNSIFKKVTGVTPKVWIAGIREGKPDLQ